VGDRVAVGDLEERRAGQVGGARERPVAGGVEGGAGAERVARPISTSGARPSVAGTCEITAATRPSSAATAITWPPEYALPHWTMRSGSTPGSPRAKPIAAW
jgi:hypothetical protein